MSFDDSFICEVNEAKKQIQQIPVSQFQQLSAGNEAGRYILIDVRENDERAAGYIDGSLHIALGQLEQTIHQAIPDRTIPLVCYCARGNRSALAAKKLLDLGYPVVMSLEGGFSAWKLFFRSSMNTSSANSEYRFKVSPSVQGYLDRLLRLADDSEHFFVSPVHIGTEEEPFRWIPRFSLFGAGRHAHGLLLAIFGGLHSADERSVAFVYALLADLISGGEQDYPDLIAYPDLLRGLSCDLRKCSLHGLEDPRVTAIRRDCVDFGYNAFLDVSTSIKYSHPVILVYGMPLELALSFDHGGFFQWQYAAPDYDTGPISNREIRQTGVIELQLQLPADHGYNFSPAVLALRSVLYGLGGYHTMGAGI